MSGRESRESALLPCLCLVPASSTAFGNVLVVSEWVKLITKVIWKNSLYKNMIPFRSWKFALNLCGLKFIYVGYSLACFQLLKKKNPWSYTKDVNVIFSLSLFVYFWMRIVLNSLVKFRYMERKICLRSINIIVPNEITRERHEPCQNHHTVIWVIKSMLNFRAQ